MTVNALALLALVVAAVVALVRYPSPPAATSPPQRPTPEQLLVQRYARGEIDDEYQRRLHTLEGVRT
jgi:putative membrane protein